MGKKARRERIEKRESFAAKRTKAKRKNTLITAGVFGAVAVIVAFAAYNFAYNSTALPGSPPDAGPLGGEHDHASVLTSIYGDTFGFDGDAYQVQNNWIHFEGRDGTTIHRHAANVTLGYMFNTLSIGLDDQCFVFPDASRTFCTNDKYSLKFYINGDKVDSITDYVITDQDRILISYGDETDDEINAQLDRLLAQPILS